MLFAYDASFNTGPVETLGARKERKARQREGSSREGSVNSDHSSARRRPQTAASTTSNTTSVADRPGTSSSFRLGGFGFKSLRKKNSSAFDSSSASISSRTPSSGSYATTEPPPSPGLLSPLSIAPLAPTTQVAHEVVHSRSHTNLPTGIVHDPRLSTYSNQSAPGLTTAAREPRTLSTYSNPVSIELSGVKDAERGSLRSPRLGYFGVSRPPSFTSQEREYPESIQSRHTPSEWTGSYYEDDYDGSNILDMFPISPNSSYSSSNTRMDSPYSSNHSNRPTSHASHASHGSHASHTSHASYVSHGSHTSYDSRGSRSDTMSPVTPTSGYDDRFKPGIRGSLPTIIDYEDAEIQRARTPLPPVPTPPRLKSPHSYRSPPLADAAAPMLCAPKTPFQVALSRMENSGLKVLVKRLSEDCAESLAGDPMGLEQALFEQNLWALMARQWLTQGKQLQCPAHDVLVSAKQDQRKILNLYGTAADGWVLAAKYPTCTVFTLNSADSHPTRNPHWNPPANHYTLHIPTADDLFPFSDNHFDVVVSRSFASVVKSKSWLPVLQECHRILKPSGWLEIQSLDAVANRQGELLDAWVESRLVRGIEDSGLVPRASERVLDYLEIAGFGEIKSCKIALPAVLKLQHQSREPDATKVMVQAGRHYYEELYHEFLRPPTSAHNHRAGKLPWWWFNRSIRAECEREGTMLSFMISFGQKEL